MTDKETRSVVAELRVVKAEDGTRTISGLIPYNSLTDDLGGYREMIAPGAFTSALAADGLSNTSSANDLAESIARGGLDSTSFGFVCQEANRAATEDDDGARTLMQVELVDVSPCSWAAHPDASVSLRSAPPEIRSAFDSRMHLRSSACAKAR